MKKEVSPGMAIAALAIFLAVAAFVFLRADRGAPSAAKTGVSGGMPPQVSAEIQRRLENAKHARP